MQLHLLQGNHSGVQYDQIIELTKMKNSSRNSNRLKDKPGTDLIEL